MRIGHAVFTLLAAAWISACGAPKQISDPSSEATPSAGSDPPAESKPVATSVGAGDPGRRRSDEYDRESTEMVLRRAARQVHDNCGAAKDETGTAIGPWGKATVQILLGSHGHSKGTTVPAAFKGRPAGNCIEKAFANLIFPPWAGSDTSVDWEVELVEPPREAPKAPGKK